MTQALDISIKSAQETLKGILYLPDSSGSAPVLVACHGAFDRQQSYEQMGHYLAAKGLATLAFDFRGHGKSSGERFRIDLKEWAQDLQAVLSFLEKRSDVDGQRIAAVGFSSGATAMFEASLIDSRLKALISLGGTVTAALSPPEQAIFFLLESAGTLYRHFRNQELRLPMDKLYSSVSVVADPDINRRLLADRDFMEGFSQVPFPSSAALFRVDLVTRAPQIRQPTLIIHGMEDKIDPPKGARLFYQRLSCPKQLEMVAGSGHMAHLDRNREHVFHLINTWCQKHLRKPSGRA